YSFGYSFGYSLNCRLDITVAIDWLNFCCKFRLKLGVYLTSVKQDRDFMWRPAACKASSCSAGPKHEIP
ncbi:MAG: hypothetical protein ACJAUI_001189, partial [Pseudohongiellaceae bacterium]